MTSHPAAQSGSPEKSAARVTPMMEQYIEIKTANPDSLLFYRMGDFYELFFDDAEVASRALGITLTKRGRHQGADIPMCGVPVHAADDYLQRLIALGHRVAVCEQTEDPADAKKRGYKAVVRRDVIRLVTPGTLTEDNLLDAGRNNYLAALARIRGGTSGGSDFAIAWIDISTGEFRVCGTSANRLSSDLGRIDPKELLLSDTLLADDDMRTTLDSARHALTPVPRAFFDGATAANRIADYFGVASTDAFGAFSRVELSAASAALAYVERTQIGERPPLAPPAREASGDFMQIDAATRANLEIARTISGEHKGSLLHAVDRTMTGAGSRLLATRIAAPLGRTEAINRRLDEVEHFTENERLRGTVRDRLSEAPDMERALSRLLLNRGGPRDFGALRSGLLAAGDLAKALSADEAGFAPPDNIKEFISRLSGVAPDVEAILSEALDDELPVFQRDGGYVRPGYRADLDEARALSSESRRVIAGLQTSYREYTGIKPLKIKHNNVLGYFVDIPASHGDKLHGDDMAETFIHRQTLANAVRFTTTELADLESKIASAGERAIAIERDVFDMLLETVRAATNEIKAAAGALAALDVGSALAELAVSENFRRPTVDDSLAFAIDGGRHPVVEQALRRLGDDPFVANACDIGPAGGEEAGHIWLVTGPNMAGKSTFLRQNALIAVLAQAGSFVPAAAAHIGIVDRLFSRVGAADDLARGRSTFMVEMVETAAILNQAGPRSFVILDEIGRGTATFDGLSIAWASIEHLHEVNQSRALFATHYHELTVLSQKLSRLSNSTVKVKEWQGDVVFLHEIVAGAADRSYGIQVARLAGLPDPVVKRARVVLDRLEEQDRKSPTEVIIDDLPLFMNAERNAPKPAAADPALTPLAETLVNLDLDDMTPKQAHETLYRLKADYLAKKNETQ